MFDFTTIDWRITLYAIGQGDEFWKYRAEARSDFGMGPVIGAVLSRELSLRIAEELDTPPHWISHHPRKRDGLNDQE